MLASWLTGSTLILLAVWLVASLAVQVLPIQRAMGWHRRDRLRLLPSFLFFLTLPRDLHLEIRSGDGAGEWRAVAFSTAGWRIPLLWNPHWLDGELAHSMMEMLAGRPTPPEGAEPAAYRGLLALARREAEGAGLSTLQFRILGASTDRPEAPLALLFGSRVHAVDEEGRRGAAS